MWVYDVSSAHLPNCTRAGVRVAHFGTLAAHWWCPVPLVYTQELITLILAMSSKFNLKSKLLFIAISSLELCKAYTFLIFGKG